MRRVIGMTADVVYRGPEQTESVEGTLQASYAVSLRDLRSGETLHVTSRDGVTVSFVYADGHLIRADVYDAQQRSRQTIKETRRQFAAWSRRPAWERRHE
jgi:hypothetical protein